MSCVVKEIENKLTDSVDQIDESDVDTFMGVTTLFLKHSVVWQNTAVFIVDSAQRGCVTIDNAKMR